jgi:hypothetical protein
MWIIDLHGFTRENQTLLNWWDTSFLLDLLLDFCDLRASASDVNRERRAIRTGRAFYEAN